MIPSIMYWFLCFELIVVSWGDIRTQKIPNFWSIANIACFIACLWVWPAEYPLAFGTFFYSFVFLAVGFALFLLKVMGGGDAKFLFSIFLLIPVTLQPRALLILLISTVLIGSFLLLINVAKNYEKIVGFLKSGYIRGIKECFGTKFSFAPVILLAWVWLGWEIGFFSL